jgi:hypothetical protein
MKCGIALSPGFMFWVPATVGEFRRSYEPISHRKVVPATVQRATYVRSRCLSNDVRSLSAELGRSFLVLFFKKELLSLPCVLCGG